MTFSKHLLLHVLSDHLDFLLTIDQDFLQLYRWFHVESFQLWDLTSPFSDMNFNMEYLVSTTFFNSYFWWLVCIFISQNLCCSLDCCISVILLVLLGSGWSFRVVESFFSINCFSKVDTLFFKSATTNWESVTWEWEWWVFEDMSAETLPCSSKLYFLQESILVR